MLRVELSFPYLGVVPSSDQSNSNSNSLLIPNSLSVSGNAFHRWRPNPNHLHHHHRRRHCKQLIKYPFISCQHFSDERFQPHSDFIQASLLLSETIRHYHLRKQGFHQETKQSSTPFLPLSAQTKHLRPENDINTLGLAILGRFHSPSIFLKISCQGDFLLPISESLLFTNSLAPYKRMMMPSLALLPFSLVQDYLNHFLFVRNISLDLGYEIKMVKITRRVVNTYFAKIYVGKAGEKASFSVDARPSDAINVARRCKAPIYVNKQIVLTDAIRIASGTGRIRDTKPVYDVFLDSAMEGPDLLNEELKLVHEMKVAVKEERYKDAAMWRDQLVKVRNSGP